MNNILLKRSAGTEGYYLFYSPKQGLCCQGVRENRLGEREVLIEHIRPDFDAVIDGMDNIHIVCQDQKKNILYFRYQREKWEKKVILQAKEGAEVYADQFRLFCKSGYLRMTYVMEHKGEKLLCAHELYEESSAPLVLDILDRTYSGYAVTQNQASDTILCYYSKEKQALGTQTYLWSQKKWGNFETVSKQVSPPIDIQIYADPRDTLHLCYKSKGTLYYRRKEFRFEHAAWNEEQPLIRRQSGYSSAPAFFCAGEQLWLCQTVGTALSATTCPLRGGEWSKMQEIPNSRTAKRVLFLLHSAASSGAMSSLHYGFIRNNQIKLLGETDYFTATEKRNVHIDGMNIPIREIISAGNDVEQFAAQSRYGNEDAYMPGNRDDIEKEKQRIKELLSGQPTDTTLSETMSQKNNSSQNDFDDFSAEYFYELLRQEESQSTNESPADTASIPPAQQTRTSPYHKNDQESIAMSLERLADAAEQLTAVLHSLKYTKNYRTTSGKKNRKLAILHNKLK